MNFIKISFILFFASQNILSQNIEKLELDKNYFLLGSLSESHGRWKTNKSSDVVDQYYSNEGKLFNKIYCLFKNEYSKINLNKVDDLTFILNSKELRQKMDSFYKWKLDEGVTNENDDVFYFGTLNTDLIKTKSQKISFLTGVIEREGKLQKESITLDLLCSGEKYNTIIKILKELNCEIISDVYYKDNIPNPHIITFIASKDILTFLEISSCNQ